MLETTDAILIFAKRETQGQVNFAGVYKLRRLSLRVPFVKQLLQEDGRFDELLAIIPDFDHSGTGAWRDFVNAHLATIQQEHWQANMPLLDLNDA
ncbi:hypothetical protein AB1Y20_022747 [Prymnesium parvum]|uniref:Uncharacterized protein n=1 Tax=Prymnesium parvum TaxID=97485 RepID=A0AB34JHX1_PRYPA